MTSPHHEDVHGGHHEDWSSDEYITHWLDRQVDRTDERRRKFVLMRAVIPKRREDDFAYINLGAGPGNLDAVLLEHFPGAQATLVDGSLLMLDTARNALERFGDRVEYVHANLASSDWTGAAGEAFDFAVSTIAIHNLRDPRRIRELYAEIYGLMNHGGIFLSFDLIRPARPSLGALAPWAAQDPEAGLTGRGGGEGLPGTLLEQLGWLAEAGFSTVDVLWKDLNMALLCGIRDHLHMPKDGEAGAATHAHHA